MLEYVPGKGGIGGSWITVSSCIFVGARMMALALVLVFESALVTGLGPVGGDMHHCSIRRVFADLIEMTITIFTSPSELASHHRASLLKALSDLENPASKTSVGQSSFPGRHLG